MPAVVRRYDRAQNKSANVGRVGLWIGKSLAYALFSQGPFCAALLMKVRAGRAVLSARWQAVLPSWGCGHCL